HAIAKSLIPLFLGDDTDRPAARAAALAALAAYHPDTLTDYLTAARAIAFSLGAVAATAIALEPELPPKQQLQSLTRANSFARLAQKAEAALEKARQHRPVHTPPHAPEPEPPFTLPTTPEEEEAMIHALINQTMAEIWSPRHERQTAQQAAATAPATATRPTEAAAFAEAPAAQIPEPQIPGPQTPGSQTSPSPTPPAGTR
ncbi:MAG TPA: hypothetical protein VE690_24210, partial [Rhodopila sp.]|nr:hypothetical protein [Rhodopila sp.]